MPAIVCGLSCHKESSNCLLNEKAGITVGCLIFPVSLKNSDAFVLEVEISS